MLLPLLLLADSFQSCQAECEYHEKMRVMPLARPDISGASPQTPITALLFTLKFREAASLFTGAFFTIPQPLPLLFSIVPSGRTQKKEGKMLWS